MKWLAGLFLVVLIASTPAATRTLAGATQQSANGAIPACNIDPGFLVSLPGGNLDPDFLLPTAPPSPPDEPGCPRIIPLR